LSGPLYRACTASRSLWRVIEITADPDDPKRTPRVSIEHAREQILQYGASSPWVQVNIFGKFPPASLNSLLGPDEISAAMKRCPRDYEVGDAPRVLGIDVARYGDDSSVIFRREGIRSLPILKYRNLDSTQGAGQVAHVWDDWQADAAFVDESGGFGAGWIDQLRQLGRAPIGVQFAGEAQNKTRYFNRRAEMYLEAIQWVKRGGALPESAELLSALTATTYCFKGDRFLLEPKDDVKAKIGFSPDEADAFALTFAQRVISKREQERSRFRGLRGRSAVQDWDPFREPRNHGEW
jgi:phage terminase large subunit